MSEFTESSKEEDTFVSFQKYSSFRNAYVEKEIDFIREFVPENEEWVAMEKIHGCNFSATTNGLETRWASRSGYLDNPSLLSFNNAPIIVEKYASNIQTSLFQHVQAMCLEVRHQKIAYIRVFGELFGGKYEGFEAKHRAIQREVSYCPGVEFIVFDIECILEQTETETESGLKTETETVKQEEDSEASEEDNDTSYSFFLTPVEVITFCQSCQIPVLDILHTGSLTEMLALDQTFQTTLPSLFNLPPTKANNEAEGYVLKPKSQIFYKPDNTRILLKHKNPKFTENCNTKTTKVPKTTNTGAHDLTELEVVVFEQMKAYINDNRINAVSSKLDTVTKSKRKGMYFFIANDAIDDIVIEMSQHFATVSTKEKNKLKKHLILYTEEYCDFHQVDFMFS